VQLVVLFELEQPAVVTVELVVPGVAYMLELMVLWNY